MLFLSFSYMANTLLLFFFVPVNKDDGFIPYYPIARQKATAVKKSDCAAILPYLRVRMSPESGRLHEPWHVLN